MKNLLLLATLVCFCACKKDVAKEKPYDNGARVPVTMADLTGNWRLYETQSVISGPAGDTGFMHRVNSTQTLVFNADGSSVVYSLPTPYKYTILIGNYAVSDTLLVIYPVDPTASVNLNFNVKLYEKGIYLSSPLSDSLGLKGSLEHFIRE
jgi:hypothetical protein